MIFVLFGTIIAAFLFMFVSTFENFKDTQVKVPEKITKRERKRLRYSFITAVNTITLRIASYRWYIDLLIGVGTYLVFDPPMALAMLLIGVHMFYFWLRDLCRLGIVVASYSVVHPSIAFIVHILTVYHALKYPIK